MPSPTTCWRCRTSRRRSTRAWNNLANQPQFSDAPLHSGEGHSHAWRWQRRRPCSTRSTQACQNASPGTRCACSTASRPASIRYFVIHEPDFFTKLDPDVLTKALAGGAQARAGGRARQLAGRHSNGAARHRQRRSAFRRRRTRFALYHQCCRPPTRTPRRSTPTGRRLATSWAQNSNSADDFFRFFPDAANFLNSFFDSAQGAAFAPGLFGGLSARRTQLHGQKRPNLLNDLRIEALQLLSPDVARRAAAGRAGSDRNQARRHSSPPTT